MPIAVTALPMALLTQVIYPGYYDQLLGVQPWILVVLTVRNVLEVAILVWSVVVLVRMGRAAGPGRVPARSSPSVRDQPEPGRMDA